MLLDADCTARLADFGYASLIGNIPEALTYLQRSTTRPGALRWSAPEQVDPEGTFSRTTKTDIYSFGCVALEGSLLGSDAGPVLTSLQVFSGKRPWSEVVEETAVVFRLAKGHKPGRPDSRTLNDSHWSFIQHCWSPMEERPAVEAIIPTIQQFLSSCPCSPPLCDLLPSWSGQADLGAEPSSSLSHAPTEGPSTYVTSCRSQFTFLLCAALTTESRPLLIRTRSMEQWMSLDDDTKQETMEVPEDPLEEGSVLVWYRYVPSNGNDEGLDGTSESMLVLGKVRRVYLVSIWNKADPGPCIQATRSVDVPGTSRWASIVRGWGDLGFVRSVSLPNRAAHIIDCRLFVNDRPGAIVRTSPKTTEHRPIVIVIASSTGRSFGKYSFPVYLLWECGFDSLVALFCGNR